MSDSTDAELRNLMAEWVELPTPGSGRWFLHIAVTHGDGAVKEDWLTGKQAQEVGRIAALNPSKPPVQ